MSLTMFDHLLDPDDDYYSPACQCANCDVPMVYYPRSGIFKCPVCGLHSIKSVVYDNFDE